MKRLIYRIDKMPSKKELYRLYVVQHKTQKEIAQQFEVDRGSLKSWLKHYKINIRTVAETITKKRPTKKTLEKLYLNNRKSITDISKMFYVSQCLVINWFRALNIESRSKSELNIIKSPSKNKLHKMYMLENKTLNQIAKLYKCSISVVKRWLIEIGIKPLNRSETFKQKLKTIKKEQVKTCLKKYGVRHPSQNDAVYNKMQSNGYKYKNYTFPSGKIIKIQGHEHYALDYLLKTYSEQDIKTGTECPTISYSYLGEIHKYHPDIFIPKENLIIEVKSPWTLLKHLKINHQKRRKTVKSGYKFTYLIFGAKGKNMQIETY